MFLLGVDEACDIPRGHEHAAFFNPLLQLCKQRLVDIGNKLTHITKDTFDASSDWFVLAVSESGEEEVICNNVKRTCVKFGGGFTLQGFTDLMIVEGDDYTKAQLWSEAEGLEMTLARVYEKNDSAPIFATEFHFSEAVAGASASSGVGGVLASQRVTVAADAAVAASANGGLAAPLVPA